MVSSGNNSMHAIIKHLCTFHYPSLPSVTLPALQKSAWFESRNIPFSMLAVNTVQRLKEGLRTGKQESFKAWEHFHFMRKNRDVRIKRKSLTKSTE